MSNFFIPWIFDLAVFVTVLLGLILVGLMLKNSGLDDSEIDVFRKLHIWGSFAVVFIMLIAFIYRLGRYSLKEANE